MPRPPKGQGGMRPEVTASATSPLTGPELNMQAAMQALVTWADSSSLQATLMDKSDFPLPGDLPAFLLVNQLTYRGAARPTDLADAIRTGRSNVSKIVRRLEAADLVSRAANPDNGRESVIFLTPHGREVAQRILNAAEGPYVNPFDGWTEEELFELDRLVVKLARSLNRASGNALERSAGYALE